MLFKNIDKRTALSMGIVFLMGVMLILFGIVLGEESNDYHGYTQGLDMTAFVNRLFERFGYKTMSIVSGIGFMLVSIIGFTCGGYADDGESDIKQLKMEEKNNE